MFDRDGRIVRVTLTQPTQPIDCYAVTFDDELQLIGDKNLGFGIETQKYRNRLCSYKGRFAFRRPLKEISLEDLFGIPLVNKNNRKLYSVPTTKPLQMPHQDLPVPPFIFGFWFFARRSTKNVAPARGTREQVHTKFKDHGYKIREHELLKHGERDFSVTPSIESQLAFAIPLKIPNNYLLGSAEQRLELLQGILCAKNRQYNKKQDRFRISHKSFRVIAQLQGLVESLGNKTSVTFDETYKYFTLFFKTRLKLLDFQESPPPKIHLGRRYIKKIQKIPSQLCIHIETDGENNSILVGEGFIPCR